MCFVRKLLLWSVLALLVMAAAPSPATKNTFYIGPPVTLLPDGRALCGKLGIPTAAPCDEFVILEAAQAQTDPSLWIGKIVGGDPGRPPPDCLRGIAVTSYAKGRVVTYACFAPDEDDTITRLDIKRLKVFARILNADHQKTLELHQFIMSFKRMWQVIKP